MVVEKEIDRAVDRAVVADADQLKKCLYQLGTSLPGLPADTVPPLAFASICGGSLTQLTS